MTSFVFSLNRHVSVGFLMAETLLGWRHTTMFIFASVWRHAFIAVAVFVAILKGHDDANEILCSSIL